MMYLFVLIISIFSFSYAESSIVNVVNPFVFLESKKDIVIDSLPYKIAFMSTESALIEGPGVYQVSYCIRTNDIKDTLTSELLINGCAIDGSETYFQPGDTVIGLETISSFYTYVDIHDISLLIKESKTSSIKEASISIIKFNYKE